MNSKNYRVIALGFFDGVHTGHAGLLNMTNQRAKELGYTPAALSFDLHPDLLVEGSELLLLNSIDDRREILSRCYGITDVILAHFDTEMMHMAWDDFIVDYLYNKLGARHLVCGYDFRFGSQGYGNADRLRQKCEELHIGCDVIPRFEMDGITVSSTFIRLLISEGRMDEATRFLGHPHCLSGVVVHGKQLGRTIGTPTANLLIPEGVITPAYGVYATKVALPDGTVKAAVTNVGTRPTVANTDTVTVEPWILDFDGDLYGKTIRVDFISRLRGEKRFSGLSELQQEILHNAQQTRELLNM